VGNLSNIRIGRCTSSDIVALTSNGRSKGEPGAPFFTYVEECRMERFFKQRLENSVEVMAFSWGKLCEKIVHDSLGFKYQFQSDVTFEHPKFPEWVGTPDGKIEVDKKVDTITDIKCPLTRKAFYNLVKDLYDFDGLNVSKKKTINGNEIIQSIRKQSKEGEKYYWQLVSNASILKARYAELIVFMPYYEELEQIKLYNSQLAEPFWLVGRAKEDELPYIYKESGIQNINVIRFEVPVEDKMFLENRVKLAIELINK
jgi:hypothetical protein